MEGEGSEVRREFVRKVRACESAFWFGEHVYSKALEELEAARADPGMLEARHVREVVKTFLAQWGRVGRTVDRRDVDWERLAERLRSSAGLGRLRGRSLPDADLDDREVASAAGEA